MLQTDDPGELIRRIREGDIRAAEELVRRYEPEIRREVRLRFHDSSARRLFDSEDVCQSVLGSFFAQVAAGRLDLDDPARLRGFLLKMAANKLACQIRGHRRARRDFRRTRSIADDAGAGEGIAAGGPGPSTQVSLDELWRKFWGRLSPDERALAEQRQQGRSWQQIAADGDESPESLRKRLARAVARASADLGFIDP